MYRKNIYHNLFNSILKLLLLIFFVLTKVYILDAQQINNDTVLCHIYVRAITEKAQIKLRWAVDNPYEWKILNKYGYKLERYTILKKGKLIANPEKTVLENRIIPMPVEEWESLTGDKYAMILVQSIYGENFSLSGTQNNKMSFINRVKEDEARYSFGLMAADLSYNASLMGGLAYTDKTVNAEYSYLYKLIALLPPDKPACDTGLCLIDAGKIRELSPVEKINAAAKEQTAILSWNSDYYKSIYIGYYIERSVNNIDFEKVNTSIYVPVYNKEKNNKKYCYFTDTLPEINKNYYYRIKGITSFSETGPYSESISLSARPLLNGEPKIIQTNIINSNQIYLKWSFPLNDTSTIKYSLLSSKRPDVVFKQINDLGLDTETTITQNESALYYKVKAIDIYGHNYFSHSCFVQLIDSTPPLPPKGLLGKIDTLGNVKISWMPNSENDIVGYKLVFANNPTREFSQLTSQIIKNNEYHYKTTLNTLTENIYIKAVAFDSHFNHSDFSVILVLKRPDIVSPVSPVFKVYSDSIPVQIEWQKSFSKDVKTYRIERKFHSDTLWKTIANIDADKTNCYDKDIYKSGKYSYRVIAIDSSENYSNNPKTFSTFIPAHLLPAPLPDIDYKINKKLKMISFSWPEDNDIDKIIVYKQTQDMPIELYQTKEVETNNFVDNNVLPGDAYAYRFRFVYNNKSYSDYSDIIQINY